MFTIYFVVVGIITADFTIAAEWSYEEEWNSKICVEGPHQSPIALSTSIAELSEFSPFSLYGYKQSIDVIVQNNGHSVKITPKHQKVIPTISGGGLPHEVYKFDHLHFHWESEHTMENKRFPLEMHLVHYSGKYKNFAEASKHTQENGVAVFSVFFYLSPDDVEEFDPLVNAVEAVKHQVNSEKELTNFIIKDFIPMDISGFYRYNGSLTTPGCDEGIIWTVFLHTLPISQHQIDVFRSIRNNHNKILKKNFRALQPLNDRPVLIKLSPYSTSGSETLHKYFDLRFVLLGFFVYQFSW